MIWVLVVFNEGCDGDYLGIYFGMRDLVMVVVVVCGRKCQGSSVESRINLKHHFFLLFLISLLVSMSVLLNWN